MIDVSDIINDPDFAQPFTIKRSTGGAFVSGGYTSSNSTIQGYGVIQPASDREHEQVPEGERVAGSISIYSATALYTTYGGDPSGLSDIVTWRGDDYRIVSVGPYQDFGFFKALAVRMSGK